MGHAIIQPPQFPKARGYANGILSSEGSGRILHIAGQIGWNQDARLVSSDFAAQFIQALDNVLAVLREAGGAPSDLVKMVVFVTDLEAYRAATVAVGEGWRSRLGKHYPAMSLVKVAGLLEPGAQVEIEGVAIFPAG